MSPSLLAHELGHLIVPAMQRPAMRGSIHWFADHAETNIDDPERDEQALRLSVVVAIACGHAASLVAQGRDPFDYFNDSSRTLFDRCGFNDPHVSASDLIEVSKLSEASIVKMAGVGILVGTSWATDFAEPLRAIADRLEHSGDDLLTDGPGIARAISGDFGGIRWGSGALWRTTGEVRPMSDPDARALDEVHRRLKAAGVIN
jgi:hypothetical protein